MNRVSTFWGLVLVVLGILFLLQSLGVITTSIWNLIWPALLILGGVWILLGAFYRPTRRTEQASVPLEGATRARVRVQHGAGHLTVNSIASPDALFEGTFGGGLECRKQRVGDTLQVDLSLSHGIFPGFWGPWNWSTGGLDWTFGLNRAATLSLKFETGANETRLDLTDLRVEDLSIETGASKTEVLLPSNAGTTRVRVRAGAASVNLRVPAGVAARIHPTGLVSADVDARRFPRNGQVYESADYATAANKVDIDAEIGAGSIQIV